MELRDYLRILDRRRWVIILTLLATVVTAGLATFLQRPAYSAVATVRIAQASSGSVAYADYMYAERLMNTYIEMLKSSALLEDVAKELGLVSSPSDLSKQVQADVVSDTELLTITVTDYDPAKAKDIANALARLLIERSRNLYFGGTKSAREILQGQLDDVQARLEQHRAELQTLIDAAAKATAAVDALNARIRSEEEVYGSLLSQYELARASEAMRENSVTVVAPAVTPTETVEGASPGTAYQATATVRVTQSSSTTSSAEYAYLVRLMNTYVELLKSQPTLDAVIQKLGLDVTPNALRARTVIEVLPDTELLNITVGDSRASRAKDIANALADLLAEQGQTMYAGSSKSAREIVEQQLNDMAENVRQDRVALQELLNTSAQENARMAALEMRIRSEEEVYLSLLRQYEEVRVTEASRESSATIVAEATQPVSPSKPRVKLNLALGVVFGAIGGIALAFLLEYLDPTLHSTDELEAAAQASVLGVIPRFAVRLGTQDQILSNHDGRSPAAEAFRMLKGNLLSAASTRPIKTLLVTGAEPETGKSTVAANLAVSMADAGLNVIVVDTDFRRPSLHKLFDLSNDLGLANVLLDPGQVKAAVQESKIPRVKVLTSGPTPPNPAEAAELPTMRDLVEELAAGSDLVVLDGPPILAVAEATTLAPMVDGVLLVAAQDQTSRKSVQRAIQHLRRIRAEVLGVVFNKATDVDAGYYYYYRDNRPSLLNSLKRFFGRRS